MNRCSGMIISILCVNSLWISLGFCGVIGKNWLPIDLTCCGLWRIRCLEKWFALLIKMNEVCEWKACRVCISLCVLCFAIYGPDQHKQCILHLEFHFSLTSSITLDTNILLTKKLSKVISLPKMDYASYFNKLWGPCIVSIGNYIWALGSPFLHYLSECAGLIYCTIDHAKGILIIFLKVMYPLQEYSCKISLTIRAFIQPRYTFISCRFDWRRSRRRNHSSRGGST